MPRLRPPQGRRAAAVVEEPIETNEELDQQNPELEAPETQEAEDPTTALKAQIEALRRSEQEAKARAAQAEQERIQAIQQIRDRDAEVTRLQEQTVSSQAEAIAAALAGAQAEAEAAQHEIETAAQLGDMKAQSEAYRKLARAEASILNLENGKAALERQAKEAPKVEPQVQQQSNDPLANINLPQLAKQWLRRNPEYLYDGRKNAKIQALHWEVVDEGYEEYSPEYFKSLEQKLGMRPAPRTEEDHMEEEAPPPRKAAVSAPPSRETPNSQGRRESRITLTHEQKEAAKITGISEEEYAKGLIQLRNEKAKGNYGGQS